MTTIHIPLVAVDQEDYYPGLIGPFGCGQYLAMMPRQVPATQAVLHAIYQWMFSNPVSFDGGNYLNLAANPSQGNLKFNQVTVENGIAKVYLSGNIMANHCGDSIFAAQIEQAAFQYPGVQSIEVYLNNQIFNWCTISAAPEEGLCANGGSILWRRDK